MATTLKVRIDRRAVDELLHGRNGPVALHQANVGRQAAGIARSIAPRGDGPGPHIADNINSRLEPSRRGYDVLLVAGVPHAMYVVKPTRPHRIQGNPLLVFDWPQAGGTVFLRHVNHPGTSGNDFMLRAVRQLGLDVSGF